MVEQTNRIKLSHDLKLSSLFTALLAVGMLIAGSHNVAIILLVTIVSVTYFYAFLNQEKLGLSISIAIYFIVSSIVIFSFSLLFPHLKFEGLLFIPVTIDLFIYLKRSKAVKIALGCMLTGLVVALFLDYQNGWYYHFHEQYRIASLSLLIVTLFFTAGNIHNLMNSPSHYIPKLVSLRQNLTDQRHRYEQLFKSATEAVFIYDFEHKQIVDCNPAFKKIMGSDCQEMSKLSHYFAPAQVSQMNTLIQYVIFENIPRSIDIEFKPTYDPDMVHYLSGTIVPFDLPNGQISISLSDISQRVRAYQDKADSEAKLLNLINSSVQGILETDLEGYVTFASQSSADMHGISYQEMIGMHLMDIVHPGATLTKKQGTAAIRRVIDQGLDTTRIVEAFQADQKPLFVQTTANYIKNGKGEKTGLILTYTDVTELRDSQQKLVENAKVFQTLFQNSFEGIDIIELENTDGCRQINGSLLLRNEAMKKLVGDNAEVFLSYESFEKLIPPAASDAEHIERKETFNKLLSKVITEDACEYQTLFLVKGEERIINITVYKIHVSAKTIVMMVFDDVTKEKQQEQEIINKNAELERYIESNMNLENFAATASHDLKSPLRTVRGFAQLINTKERSVLSPKSRESLDIILSSTSNMSILLDDLMTFSRVDRDEIKFDEINLEMLIRNVLKDIHFDIDKAGADVIIGDLPLLIKGDEIKLYQVFLNLIRNAIKFVKEGETPKVTIESKSTSDKWHISVSDNGIGIPKNQQENIFKIFKKLHAQEKYEGSGVGLAICGKIIKLHGGEITVDSELGKGSTFTIHLQKNPVLLRSFSEMA